MVFVVPLAHAERWCQWSGTEGINCINDRDGVIRLPDTIPIRTVNKINALGYYRVVITQPTIGADQKRGAEIWGFAANEISLTWAVEDMTAEEIAQRTAGAMPISEYYLWKALLATGTITQQQAATYLPQELIDAYQARDALENP